MKQRVISGIFIAALTILSAYYGSYLLKAVLLFIGIYGSYEFINVSNRSNRILLFIMTLSVLAIYQFHDYEFSIMLLEMIALLAYCVFRSDASFTDVGVVFLMSQLIGNAIYLIEYLQVFDKWLLGYIFIVSYMTDVFAFFVGMKFGKHKLNERISPKKTVEGSIGGWLFGSIISFFWAMYFGFFKLPSYIFIISSLLLPIISEVGDLIFSMIKRHYGVKDFSDLIPGHGGILDRLDSHFICILFFGSLLNIFIL